MGTRSLTKVYNQFDGELICEMFRHFDGYPTGAGLDIKKALLGVTVGNGIRGDEPEKFVNRMGKVVSYLIRNSDIDYEFTNGCNDWIEFTYHLRFMDGRIHLTVDDISKEIWSGMLDDFDPEKLEESMCDE